MKLRRAAIAVAATIGLALSAAAPAMANHDTPDRHDHPNPQGGNVTCEFLGLEFLDKIEYDGDQPTSVDVDPDDYPGETIIAVIVKAGNSSFVYTTPPFEHLTGPDGKEISHIELCKGEEPPGEEPPGEEPPGEEPPGEEPPGEEPPGEEPPGEEPPGEEPPGEEPAKPDTTPAPVPTSVPAGYGDSASLGAAGTVGLLAALTVALAAGAALVRRRFGHES